jgi:hypothetical protein
VLEVWRDRLLPSLPDYDESVPLRQFLETSMLAFGEVISRTDCRQAAICILAEAHRDPKLYQRESVLLRAPSGANLIKAGRLAIASANRALRTAQSCHWKFLADIT